jgi:hypothetical protein
MALPAMSKSPAIHLDLVNLSSPAPSAAAILI